MENTKKTAVFTISSANYFAKTQVLLDSLRQTNKSFDRFFAIADAQNGQIEDICNQLNVKVIEIDELDIPDRNDMLFRYDIMELNTAIKPFVFLKLLESYDRVIYLDPDIKVYQELKKVSEAFDNGYHFVITPHFTGYWEEDNFHPDEPDILRAGIYNFGFFAADSSAESIKALKWWAKKLETLCVNKQQIGIFVDQKWMDLLPGRCELTFILRDEGYNVAYWNLQHRKAKKVNNKFYFNNDELVFFHFSGYSATNSENISKHQNRFNMEDIGVAKELFYDYAKECKNNEQDRYEKYLYKYNYFNDGRKIKNIFRWIYREDEYIKDMLSNRNPFDCADFFYDEFEMIIPAIVNYLFNNNMKLGCNMISTKPEDIVSEVECYARNYYKLNEYQTNYIKFFVSKKLYEVWSNSKISICLEPHMNTEKMSINLVGYVRSEHGMGEACRLVATALNTTHLNWRILDWEKNNLARKLDAEWEKKIVLNEGGDISLFVINADQIKQAREDLPSYVWNSYRIGIWYWELTEFPEKWKDSLKLIDEIWAPTKYIQENLQKITNKPVLYMPSGIYREKVEANRKRFGLPENAFLFLAMFDLFSYTSRKNPLAVLNAFVNAFGNIKNVGLVIKISNFNRDNDDCKEVAKIVDTYENIYLISEIYTRSEINMLIYSCDVAVSLHRSEGLGLLCQEAMFYGKPVIATNWSGNTDFMNDQNACMVGYRMVDVKNYPFAEELKAQWAEPDINQASEFMLRLYNDRDYYDLISRNAENHIKTLFSPEICGKRMEDRLKAISKESFNWKWVKDDENIISQETSQKDAYSRTVLKQTADKKNIVIFGIGRFGLKVYNLLKKNGIEILCFCDNSYLDKQRTVVDNIKLRDLKEVIMEFPEAYYLVTPKRYLDVIESQLEMLGVLKSNIFKVRAEFIE